MLTLTDTASTVVKTIVSQTPDTDTAGIRIQGGGDSEFVLGIAPNPEASDTVVDSEGARVFLDEDAAQVLDDKILDAQVDDEGGVRFAIAQQAV
ncbi:Fe-S cluster assembly protein HesB [Herbiconiux sp. L3-i23]|uniref:Fe-S cluster assembly protein HesB n=1 Tax=Herbiconiux sp. L3-i23 TaxID=2905871 RepID=UPI002067C196|nr:Fe-S cluster assembly protein HesB [Herbiconiux sp. L3-i23]BDI23681.1 iron-sulfur cluster biosynthesis protein [Herbiconiux sp. L3-i23]